MLVDLSAVDSSEESSVRSELTKSQQYGTQKMLLILLRLPYDMGVTLRAADAVATAA